MIKRGLAQQLGLQPVGITAITTPSSSNVACPMFSVRLLFPKGVVAEQPVIEAPLQGQNIQALIGRDILRHSILVYIGLENQFTLSF